ncbi:MAG: hypothetical protein ABJP82_11810, partial [Hyphomicrobiales bacterium]
MKHSNRAFALISLFLVAVTGCTDQTAPERPDFRNSVASHLEAVETRDYEAFRGTLTKTDDLY